MKISEKPFPVACQYENRQHSSFLHCLSTTSLQETHLSYSLVPCLVWGEAPFSTGAVLLPHPPQLLHFPIAHTDGCQFKLL